MRRKFTKYPKAITASKMSDLDLLAREALECTTKEELGGVISGLDSLGLRKLFLHYMEMLRDDSLSVGYIASDLSDTLYNMFSGIEATTKPKYFANMVSATSSDSAYDENDKLYTYCVEGCYSADSNGHPYGLADSLYTNDFNEVLREASNMANQGLYITIKNQETGDINEYSPDEWDECLDLYLSDPIL